LDLLVVTPAGLGAINTTLPTVGHVRQTGLRVRWGTLTVA
jgi:dethiobiotin synthetase